MTDNGSAAELNGGEDDEEALRIAIAMSLGQDPAETQHGDETHSSANRESDASQDLTRSPPPQPRMSSPFVTSSLVGLGMDRKKMEAERLERVRKRKAGDLQPPSSSRPVQRVKTYDNEPSLISKAAPSPKVLQPRKPPGEVTVHSAGSALVSSLSNPTLQFGKGVIKKTWAFGYPRLGDDIKIEEIFQKKDLEFAVLSSFQWDTEWLLSKLDLDRKPDKRTKVVLVAFAADETQRKDMQANAAEATGCHIRFCFPPMQGAGSMHSKLQLLKFKDCLRIVVPTGNLLPYDWGETGIMENAKLTNLRLKMVFIIDLPKLGDSDQTIASNNLTPFGKELSRFLSAQGFDDSFVNTLQKYDFKETERCAFVHTIGKPHTDPSWKYTGYCGLGRAVNALGLATDSPINIEFVTSSLGALNVDLLRAFYCACQGDSGLKEYRLRTSKSKNMGQALETEDESVLSRFRVYFPSHNTVAQSRGGEDAAGTICFQPRWWNAEQFPRAVLRDCKSKRSGLLMHSKMVFVRRPVDLADDAAPGFAYVGSANFTESAWGRLVKDRTSGSPKLTCRNWECGVLVEASVSTVDRQAGDAQDRSDSLSMFTGVVPVPMEYPGVPFTQDNKLNLSPWFFRPT